MATKQRRTQAPVVRPVIAKAEQIAGSLHPVANPAVDCDGNFHAAFSGARAMALIGAPLIRTLRGELRWTRKSWR